MDEKNKEIIPIDRDKKKIMITVAVGIMAVLLIVTVLAIKSKKDYEKNTQAIDKYAREYYNKNMRNVNPAASYSVNLKMLEKKYELKYFEKCDKTSTYVEIFVDKKGKIVGTKTNIEC